jgi:hypothetical protein
MSDPQNYMVHVNCPHCSKHHVVAISGFGGELATREKFCSKCSKPYYVHLIAQTAETEAETPIVDGEIAGARERIKWLQQQRKKTLAELLIEHEACRELHNQALEMARKMRASADIN